MFGGYGKTAQRRYQVVKTLPLVSRRSLRVTWEQRLSCLCAELLSSYLCCSLGCRGRTGLGLCAASSIHAIVRIGGSEGPGSPVPLPRSCRTCHPYYPWLRW